MRDLKPVMMKSFVFKSSNAFTAVAKIELLFYNLPDPSETIFVSHFVKINSF